MKAALFAILKDYADVDTAARRQIQRMFIDLLGSEVEHFLTFDDARVFQAELRRAISQVPVIVAAADKSCFLEQKWGLLKSMGMKSEICPRVLQALQMANVSDVIKNAHAVMPMGASIFLTANGMYSGFAVRSGQQTLLYLPMITGPIGEILRGGVESYVRTELCPAAVISGNNERFAQTAQILAAQGLEVAFASTQTNLYIQSGVRTNPVDGASFIPAIVADDPDSRESVTERIACLADAARREIGTSLGVAISNIYSLRRSSGDLYLYIALADNRSVHVRKITGAPGMSTGDLVFLATNELYTMLQSYAAGEPFLPGDTRVRPRDLNESGTKIHRVTKSKRKTSR